MKCDLREPMCTNCLANGKDCEPAPRATRPRPTHERIQQLETEVTDLEAFLGRLAHLPPGGAVRALEQWSQSGSTDTAQLEEQDGTTVGGDAEDVSGRVEDMIPPSRLSFSISRTAAHGPTSAFFDDLGERDHDLPHAGRASPSFGVAAPSEAELRDQATARCAEERHMEILNLASGKLDFDGVPADLAMHLLALHWNRQHFAFLITYRPLFTRDMACAGPYFSKLLLNAIFFSVSKFSDRPDVYDDLSDQSTAGRRFLRRVKELLGEALDQSTLPTIQAMLLLSSSLFALGHQSAAWLYSGIAIRMIFDLGLHYDCSHRVGTAPGSLAAEELEIRRRVVWAAFIYDKVISLYQGRAVSFAEDSMHVPHRFLDHYEEQELWTPYAFPGIQRYPGAPARAISTFTSLCSLAVIMGRIITYIYADQGSLEQAARHLRRLSANLDQWKASVPPEITFDPTADRDDAPPPHVLSLHLMFYTLVTLLHRPFVETGNRQMSDPNIVALSWARCEDAARGATAVLGRYRRTFTLARAPYLISYTTYVAATIHVRMAAQRGPQSEAGRLLSVCLEALQENAATNPGVRKMYATVCSLMVRLGVHLDVGSSVSENTALPSDLDLDAIIRSFGTNPLPEPGGLAVSELGDAASAWTLGHDQLALDNLYGFLGFDPSG
ncbi:hypothetical protein Q5752_004909 [Cryptotrichosporon argae]